MKKLLFVLIVLVFIPFIIKAAIDVPKISEITIAPKAIKELTKKQQDSIATAKADSTKKAKHAADSIIAANGMISQVTGVFSINRKDSTKAIIGDFIKVHVDRIYNILDTLAKGKRDSIFLFLNDIPMTEIHPYTIGFGDSGKGYFMFELRRDSVALQKIDPYFEYMWSTQKMLVSVGVRNKHIHSEQQISIAYTSLGLTFFVFSLLFLIIMGIIIASKENYIVRLGDKPTSPYSLARCQLAFWTVLIALSFLYLWIVNGVAPTLPPSVLILLGISMATTATAGYIDYSKKDTDKPNINIGHKNFLYDILSDGTGVNIQRSQMFLWTLILGFIFLYAVFSHQKMLNFNDTLLILMGISSGTYALLKTQEAPLPTTGTPPVTTTATTPLPTTPTTVATTAAATAAIAASTAANAAATATAASEAATTAAAEATKAAAGVSAANAGAGTSGAAGAGVDSGVAGAANTGAAGAVDAGAAGAANAGTGEAGVSNAGAAAGIADAAGIDPK